MAKTRPSADDPRDPNAKSFSWKEGIGKEAKYVVLHIENGVIYAVYDIGWSGDKDKLLENVKNDHPLKVWPNVMMLFVDDIVQLVYCANLHRLEIHHGDKNPAVISAPRISGEIYQTLRGALTKQYRRSVGQVSAMTAASAPLGMLLLVVLVGGGASYLVKDQNVVNMVVPVVTGILALASICWAVAWMMFPPKTEILTISAM